jgi:hypothetical protein
MSSAKMHLEGGSNVSEFRRRVIPRRRGTRMQQLSIDSNTEIKGQLRPFVYLWAKQIGSSSKYERVFSPNVVGVKKPVETYETTGGGSDEDVIDTTSSFGDPTPA